MMKPPKKAETIKHDLEGLLTSMIERGIADDQNFPVLRFASNNVWEVTFAGAEHVSIAMGNIDYETLYKELSEKRSYTAKLIDGGLLQLMYRFEGERLLQNRLAYYPSPELRPFQEEPESYLYDELFLDIVSRRIVPFPLRFDFDETAARDVVHPMSHLTLGDVKGCRIPVSAPLTPRWFVDFVLRNFYLTDRYDFVSKLPNHRMYFDSTITVNERRLIHIVIPTI
ncbi:MAG: hypothetical protein BSOLF_1443 [Candidatus Carbobacillus altaicus]|uniref:DUF2290 domain-containing protein n=1 Tax=Candidatus Carbonibacillus altaicus TaxID=2163959 RepID=A0A2R6XZG3_9BACL|nr:MAG: hypothetical protein BSOLF_1443 [Candidatus Carbobacillus altaicus]